MKISSSTFYLINREGRVYPPSLIGDFLSSPGEIFSQSFLTVEQTFDLIPEQAQQFQKWIDLVFKKHKNMRWEKLAPLSPLLEIKPNDNDPLTDPLEVMGSLRLHYRKLENSQGNLVAIMVMGIDAAPTQLIQRQLEDERHRHQLEIRDVLALSANPPETLGAFLTDAAERLQKARSDWEIFLTAEKKDSLPIKGENAGQKLFRELHMIKGNAGAFGFEGLAANAQACEELLEALKKPSPDGIDLTFKLSASLASLRSQVEEVRRALKLIAGEGQDAMTRILKWKLDRTLGSAAEIPQAKIADPQLQNLVNGVSRLSFLSPTYLARKYQNLVERISMNLGKQIIFRVTSNTGDIHPESFSRVDEALVHILRNMVDHGIEFPSERKDQGKDEAKIEMEYVDEDDRIFLRIRDDGRGMNPELIAERGKKLGIIEAAELEFLDATGKLGLIFKEGFTTRDGADMVSGRGLGLALAARCVKDHGGNIFVFSQPHLGTHFAIELPKIGQKHLPD